MEKRMVRVRVPEAPIAPPPRTGDESLSLRLKHAERTLRLQLAPVLDAEDLLFEHWQVMAVLLAQPGLRMSDLAEAAAFRPELQHPTIAAERWGVQLGGFRGLPAAAKAARDANKPVATQVYVINVVKKE